MMVANALLSIVAVVAALVPLVALAVAYVLAISMFIDVMRAKGYKAEKTGILWFVGVLLTPVVLGLYVNALPDLGRR